MTSAIQSYLTSYTKRLLRKNHIHINFYMHKKQTPKDFIISNTIAIVKNDIMNVRKKDYITQIMLQTML